MPLGSMIFDLRLRTTGKNHSPKLFEGRKKRRDLNRLASRHQTDHLFAAPAVDDTVKFDAPNVIKAKGLSAEEGAFFNAVALKTHAGSRHVKSIA
jgi:hypothetical protein